ncbi:MAG: PAS domain S-box protein [Magnetococcales bacterium]|nr:PAS domain S-box protein [Magnetococcales bacterium]
MASSQDNSIWRIQKPIIASFLLAYGALLGLFLLSLNWMHSEQEQGFNNRFQQEVDSALRLTLEESRRAMEGQLLGLTHDQELQTFFLARQRDALLRKTLPMLQYWQREQGISHLYFHDATGTNILRVHNPTLHGDRIQRLSTRLAIESLQTAHGLEIGLNGELSLRVVLPWKVDGVLIGLLEMGKDLAGMLPTLRKILQADLHLFLNKAHLDLNAWKGRTDHPTASDEWDHFPDVVRSVGTSHALPPEMARQVRANQWNSGLFEVLLSDVEGGNHRHHFTLPLRDIRERDVARLLVIYEDQALDKITNAHKNRVILGITLSALFLAWMFRHLLSRIEGNLRKATAELRHGEERNRAILDTALDAIISIDTQGRILEFNKAAERTFGFRKQDVLGHDISETIIPPEFRESHRQGMTRYLTTGEQRVINQHIEIYAINAKGTRLPTEIAITVIPGEQFTFFTAFLRDISERKQMLSSLNDAIAQAESSNLKMRQEMIRHEQTLARLQSSEERFRSVTLSIRDAIIAVDCDQKIIFWNKGAEALFGYTKEEILGQTLRPLIPDRYAEAHRVGFKRFRQTGHAPMLGLTTEMSGRRKDGQEFPLEMSLNAWTHADGTRYFSAVIRDITERKQAEAALLAAKESAEAANRAKSLFLANMSHEIRTPMNTIIGLGYLLSQTPLTPGQQSRMRKIQYAAETLLGIINDILDFSKIEAGRLELEFHPFQLGEVMEKVASMVSMRAEEKGLEILFALPPDLPRSLVGDALRLEQILINLGTNAIKFTQSGEIVFRVEALEVTETTARLRFSVKDSGIGLTEEQIAGLFQPFVQADSSTTRHYGGTGLGLAICKSLVDQMNGAFTVISAPGAGSEFAFTVPLARQFAHEPVKISLGGHHSGILRVLVVDDNDSSRMILSEMVRGLDCTVQAVPSGPDALDEMRRAIDSWERPYDLILLDWQMPDMDGIETARHIREIAANNSSLVIMVTAHGRQEVMREAKDVGINGFVLKPVTPSTLLNTIQEALGRGMVAPQATESGPVKSKERLPAHLKGARILVVEDHEINWQVAEGILAKAGIASEHAANGKEAVERIFADPQRFDLVLMDLQMPVMDGYEATRRLRMRFDAARMPIVAMTANALKSEKDQCLAIGMNDYLTKPVNVAQLFAVLGGLIPDKNATPGTEDGPLPEVEERLPSNAALVVPASEIPPAEIEGMDIPAALERLDGDVELLMRLTRQFVTAHRDTPERIDAALTCDDTETARALAHGVKGVAGNLSANRVAEQASRLEILIKEGDLDGARKQLDGLRTEVSTLIAAIDRHAAKEPIPALAIEPLEQPGLPPGEMERLLDLLNDGDFQARERFATLRPRLHGRADAGRLDRIQQHLEMLAFEEAAMELAEELAAWAGQA